MIQSITVDLIPNGKMPMLHASQYDDGRQVRINLTENRQAYTLTGNEVLSLAVRKADNTLVTMDIANTFGGKSYVEFATTEQMCAVSGLNFGELTITNNGTKVGSLNFYLACEPSPEAGGLRSRSEILNLNRQIDDHIDEVLPDMVEDIAPAIVEEVAPAVVREVAPSVVEDVAPAILDRLAPSAVAEAAPAVVAELVPPAVAEVAPSVVREVAEPIVEELVPIAVGNNYYNKTQADEKFATIAGLDEANQQIDYIEDSFKVGFNIYNGKYFANYTWSNAGVLVETPGRNSTDLIPVDSLKGKTIRASKYAYKILILDQNKAVLGISSKYAISIDGTSAKYVAFTFETSITDLMVTYTNETSGYGTDTWSTLFPGMGYVPYQLEIDASKIMIGEKTVVESLSFLENRDQLLSNDDIFTLLSKNSDVAISVDPYTKEKVATFTGISSTKTWESIKADCVSMKAYCLEFMGKTSDASYSASVGAFLVIEFFDDNDSMIGTKYNAMVLGESRRGFHRYGFVSPLGAKTIGLRFVTRANTNMELSDISLRMIDSYPQKQRNGIKFDGHLGMTLVAPRNTMIGFELGKVAGFDTMITNVKVTSDGVLVALHDETIDATSDGTGNVRDFTYNQLLSYDFGSWFNSVYTGTKIPKFEGVVKFLSNSGIKVGVSLHGDLSNSELSDMCDILKKYGQRKCLIKSFSFATLQYVYSILGNDAEYIFDTDSQDTSTIDTLISLGAENITLEASASAINQSMIDYAIAHNVGYSVYYGNDLAFVREAINMGVSRFCVDTFSDIVFPMD